MDFFVLSPPEATGLYLGLAIQALIRTSSLVGYLPYLLILVGGLLLCGRIVARDGAGVSLWLSMAGYVSLSLLLLILFWPEATPFGTLTSPLAPEQIASYTATQDAAATIRTAADTGEVDTQTVLETPGFRLFLRAGTDLALALARTINQQAHRPLGFIVSTSWLLGMEMTANVTRALTDWVEGCWKPSMAADQEFQDAVTSRDLMPWDNTPVAQALATREMVPGSMTGRGYFQDTSPLGTLFLANPTSPAAVRCDVYLSAVEMEVQRWLFTTPSPAGTPLSQVFDEDLGMNATQQARFLVYREALRAMGRPSPAPSLIGAYGALTAAQVGAGAVSGLAQGLRRGGAGNWLGGLFGGAHAAGDQFSSLLATFTWWVGAAMWLVYWAPFVIGIALQAVVGFFPLVLCYSLVAGQQFRSLVVYFLALLWLLFTPVWFALIDLAARAATTQAPQSTDALLSLLNWAPGQTYSIVVTVLGIFLVPPLGAGVFFVSGRYLTGILGR